MHNRPPSSTSSINPISPPARPQSARATTPLLDPLPGDIVDKSRNINSPDGNTSLSVQSNSTAPLPSKMTQSEFDSKLQSSTILTDLINTAVNNTIRPLQQQIDALQQQLQSMQQSQSNSLPHDFNKISLNDNHMNTSNTLHEAQPNITARRSSLTRSPMSVLSRASSDSHVSLAGNAEGDNLDQIADVDPRTLLSNRLKNRVTTTSHDNSNNTNDNCTQRKLGLGSNSVVIAGHAIHQLGVNSTSNRQRGTNSSNEPELILVEDVRVSARVANTALTRAHYRVVVASDGESAVEQYKQNINTVRVILMDINLPGISGIEATEQIRAYEQKVNAAPVLIYGLTGNVDEDNLRSYQKVGMNGCIMKGKLLVEAVQQAMAISERNPKEFVNLANQRFVADNQSDNSTSNTSSAIQPNNTRVITPVKDNVAVRQTDAPYITPEQVPAATANQSPPNDSQTKQQPASSTSALGITPSMQITRSLSAGSRPELLLVEDVRVSARVAQAALTRAHYKVDVANDGESAVDKYKAHSNSIKIILMDINLPGISGIEATEQIRRYEKSLKSSELPVTIFGLTGNVEEENLRLYEAAGMNGCILKGKLLPEAVKQGVQAVTNNPTQFVNLSQQAPTSPATTTQTIQQRVPIQTQSQPPPSSSSSASPTNQLFSGVHDSEPSNAQQIGTPRQAQPRQLLYNKSKQDHDAKKGPIRIGGGSTLNSSTSTTSPSNSSVSQRTSSQPDLLLVEDVNVSARVAQAALKRASYKVSVASDGESAVDLFKSYWSTLRIILMDINLPGISGVEATEQIRKYEVTLSKQQSNYRPVLIYGLTGNVDSESLLTYESAGMNGCIMKGNILVDSVKEAEKQSLQQPNTFINLVN